MTKLLKTTLFIICIAICYKMFIADETYPSSNEELTASNFKSSEESMLIKKHAELYGNPHVVKVRDHVYVAVGYALANMIMIEGN